MPNPNNYTSCDLKVRSFEVRSFNALNSNALIEYLELEHSPTEACELNVVKFELCSICFIELQINALAKQLALGMNNWD